MIRREKNNSIIFLTTLSVYLGLVLVGGASPQVWAQQSDVISRQSKTSKIQSSKGDCPETSIAGILAILATYDVGQIPLGFTYRINYSEDKFPILEILLAEGDKSSVESLRRFVTCNVDLLRQIKNERSEDKDAKEFSEAIFFALIPYNSVLHDIKASNQEIVSKVTYSFSTDEQAKKYFTQLNQSATSHIKKVETPELTAESNSESIIVNNSTYQFENNQVFIVTRLPRGSLDKLVKQGAKANSK